MLTPEQKHAYINDGYFTLEETIPKTLAEEVRREFKLITGNKRGGILPGDYEWWSDYTIPDRTERKKIIQRISALPTITEPVQELIGSDTSLLITDLAIIRKGTGYIAWHQDHGYLVEVLNKSMLKVVEGLTADDLLSLVPVANQSTLFITIYLQDTDNSMGALRAIPGSHQWDHTLDPPAANALDKEVDLPLPGGAAMFNTPSVWHTAAANTSTTNYWTLTLICTKNNIEPLAIDALKDKI